MNTKTNPAAGRPATLALFDDPPREGRERLGPGAFVLPGLALPFVDALLPAIEGLAERAPFRHLVTPGGFTMSVALTNCGALGWTSDRRGYRYSATDHSGLSSKYISINVVKGGAFEATDWATAQLAGLANG